jgi:hypothetical protein
MREPWSERLCPANVPQDFNFELSQYAMPGSVNPTLGLRQLFRLWTYGWLKQTLHVKRSSLAADADLTVER